MCVSAGIFTGNERRDFLAEIDMMKKIAEGYNPHIVNMVGCVTLQEPLCLITEFVPYGDLLSYLKYQRKKVGQQREGGREGGTGDRWTDRQGWDDSRGRKGCMHILCAHCQLRNLPLYVPTHRFLK